MKYPMNSESVRTITAWPAELVLHLWEVFPVSFNINKTTSSFETVNAGSGTYERCTGSETENLAECILNTANAFCRPRSDLSGGLRYIDEYKPGYIQQREIRSFLKR